MTIRFHGAQAKVAVELGLGALRVSAALARRARQEGAVIPVLLSATDTSRHTTRRTVRVPVPR